MALGELRSSFGVRVENALDGVPGLVSYLLFTALQRNVPALARSADRIGQLWRGRSWHVGQADTEAGPVDIGYLGSADGLAHWLLDRLGARAMRRAGETPRVAGGVRCTVELVLIRPEEAVRRGREGWLILPRYVRHRQPLGSEPSDFERHVGERLRASGMTLRLSRDAVDLERFQRELYDPMLRRRHGDRALRTGRALLRLGQRRGGLLVAEVAGRPMAAAVGVPSANRPGDLEIWALGVAGEAPRGAGLAPVLGWVRWARERGFAAVDHLASLPLYSDALTQQKLRWKTVLSMPPESYEWLALRVHGTGSLPQSFLARHTFAAWSRAGIIRVHAKDAEDLACRARALAVG